jgi:hypothetical protein
MYFDFWVSKERIIASEQLTEYVSPDMYCLREPVFDDKLSDVYFIREYWRVTIFIPGPIPYSVARSWIESYVTEIPYYLIHR